MIQVIEERFTEEQKYLIQEEMLQLKKNILAEMEELQESFL